jgi:hypothetical protein
VRPEIQATLSTWIGWTAKRRPTAAAERRPNPSADASAAARMAATACSRTLVRWNPSGSSPQRAQSRTKERLESGR